MKIKMSIKSMVIFYLITFWICLAFMGQANAATIKFNVNLSNGATGVINADFGDYISADDCEESSPSCILERKFDAMKLSAAFSNVPNNFPENITTHGKASFYAYSPGVDPRYFVFEDVSFNLSSKLINFSGVLATLTDQTRQDGLIYHNLVDVLNVFNDPDGYPITVDVNGVSGTITAITETTNPVATPIPAAIWLMGSAFIPLLGFKRQQRLKIQPES